MTSIRPNLQIEHQPPARPHCYCFIGDCLSRTGQVLTQNIERSLGNPKVGNNKYLTTLPEVNVFITTQTLHHYMAQ